MPQGLTQEKVDECRKKIKRMGNWCGVRWLRNQGVEFEHAHWIMFGRLPRK